MLRAVVCAWWNSRRWRERPSCRYRTCPRRLPPWLRHDPLVVTEAFRIIGIAAPHHAVVGVARTRNEASDVGVGSHFAGDGVEGDVLVVDPRRLVEPRGPGTVVPVRHEGRRGQVGIPGLEPQEAHAVVERDAPAGLPRVLQVRLDEIAVRLHLGKGVDLGVVPERADERVREGVAGVERVGAIGREVELPGPRAGTDAALPSVL